jgi:hypothetical protein
MWESEPLRGVSGGVCGGCACLCVDPCGCRGLFVRGCAWLVRLCADMCGSEWNWMAEVVPSACRNLSDPHRCWPRGCGCRILSHCSSLLRKRLPFRIRVVVVVCMVCVRRVLLYNSGAYTATKRLRSGAPGRLFVMRWSCCCYEISATTTWDENPTPYTI